MNADPKKSGSSSAMKPSGTSKLTIALCGFIVFGVAGYIVQQLIKPKVDAAQTKPVVVNNSQASANNSVDSETPDLPPGSVTAKINQKIINEAEHPFIPLMEIARESVKEIDNNINDYTATLVSQVFFDGVLQPEKYLKLKIRHKQTVDGKEIPFSVYTLFLKPKASVGQEAIWVQGQNDGKLIAHATGLLNIKRAYLDPEGAIPMDGNRYPIYDIGFRNLIVKMIELGEKDIKHGECEVTIKRKVEINGIPCTMLQALHPIKRDHFDFHIARIYIDDARNVPIAYEGYLWPEKEGDEPPLLEKYYYTDIETNIGLTDVDFDPGNEEYNYPAW